MHSVLADEWCRQKGTEMTAVFKLDDSNDCGLQDNGYDCGVFVCCFALCLVYKLPITTFKQGDAVFFRRHIALCVRLGELANFITYTGTKPKFKVPRKILAAHQAALASKLTPIQHRTRSKRKLEQQEGQVKKEEPDAKKSQKKKGKKKAMVIQDPCCDEEVQVQYNLLDLGPSVNAHLGPHSGVF